MNMQGKVWLVTSGDYSNYKVDAAFSTEGGAQEYAKHCNGPEGLGDFQVEEFELDKPHQTWLGSFVAQVETDGTVRDCWWSHESRADQPAEIHERSEAFWKQMPHVGRRYFMGFGKTEEHARRSAEQLRRETLALPFLEDAE